MHSVDFLEPTRGSDEPARPVWARVLRVFAWIIVWFLVLSLGAIGLGVGFGFSAYMDVQSALVSAKRLDMPRASSEVAAARGKLQIVSTALVLVRPFEYVPVLGPQLQASRVSVDAGVEGLLAAQLLLHPIGDVLHLIDARDEASAIAAFRELSPEKKKAFLTTLLHAAPSLDRAAEHVRTADDKLAVIASEDLFLSLRAQLDPVKAAVHDARAYVDTVVPMAKLLPELLGGTDERTLLFVFQNSDELRPTGGFIGTYGIFHAKDGDFTISDIRDVYTVDRPSAPFFHEIPPEPFVKYLASTGWYFRDANWSPHFPESARTLLDFYTRERGERGSEMDGVLAVTPRVIEKLVALVGCMTIQDVEFCPENFMETLQYEVEQAYDIKGIPDAERKQIIAPLAAEFLRRMYALPSSQLPELFDIVRDSFITKDVLLWSKDTALQAAVEDAGIAGRVAFGTPDGLMVVDANLGGMKTDPYVKREIRYTVEPSPDGRSANGLVAITYRNTAPEENWKWTTYRTYTRVYLPAGTQWIETLGSLDHDRFHNPERKPGKTVVQNELGLVSMGAFTAVDIGETRTLTFRFTLASQVWEAMKRGDYQLTVLRQPGSPDPTLTLDIGFDTKLRSAEPPESVRYYGDSRYQVSTDMSVDRKFTVDLNE